MRDIKFRGKHTELGGDWVYGNLVICENGDCLIGHCKEYGINSRYMRNQVYSDSVGQYIGQKDDRGTEIYEGDIVYYDAEEDYFLVEWDKDTSRFLLRSESLIIDFDNCYSNELDVVGNVYDSPHLMNL